MWWQRSGSTLAQVMACCLTAPIHYLNQCSSMIISEFQWHWYLAISQEMPQPSITKICLKITHLKLHSNFPRAQWVKVIICKIVAILVQKERLGFPPLLLWLFFEKLLLWWSLIWLNYTGTIEEMGSDHFVLWCRPSCLQFRLPLTGSHHSSRADFRFAPSQWEMALLCNDISHWLGPGLESALQ